MTTENNTLPEVSDKPKKPALMIALCILVAVLLIAAAVSCIGLHYEKKELREYLMAENGWVDNELYNEDYFLRFTENEAILFKYEGEEEIVLKTVEYKTVNRDTLHIWRKGDFERVCVFANKEDNTVLFNPCLFDEFYYLSWRKCEAE